MAKKSTPKKEKVESTTTTASTDKPENTTKPSDTTVSKPDPGQWLNQLKDANDVIATLREIQQETESDMVRSMVTFLVDYIEKMGPGKTHIPQKGAHTQYGLYHTLKGVIESDYPTFIQAMGVLLGVFYRMRETCFGPYYVFRYLDKWPGTNEEKRTFMYLLDFIGLFATTDRSRAVKQIDVNKLTDKSKSVLSDTGIENIKKFINM